MPLSLRRLLLLVIGMPLFIFLQFIHWLGFLIDEICFSAYRKVEVKAPLFISGIPRSGTTFVHRTLATNRSAFCTVSTWEAILAPSITERKCIARLRSLDRRIGSPLKKTINSLLSRASGEFNEIHEVGINAEEEDYLWLLPAGSCFILSMAFPFSRWLQQIAAPEKIPKKQRNQLLDFYQSCIQRHLYYHGTNRTFLSKNAAFAGWVELLAGRFPDARFLICVRHPMSALSSQLSSLRPARELFAIDPDGSQTKERMTAIFRAYYQHLAHISQSMSPKCLAIIDQTDLRADATIVLNQATKQLSLESIQIPECPEKTKKSQKSPSHQHSPSQYGLENKEIEVCLMPAYQVIIQAKQRV
ncbi:MAG: sulfotransferase [Coraliomargaritaceae bacterium]